MVTDVLAVEAAIGRLPLPVYSGIPMNSCTGGINPDTVDLTLAMGGKVVWFPTISAHKHACLREELKFPDPAIVMRPPREFDIVDSTGRLVQEAREVLEIVRDRGAILMTGHSDAPVIDQIIREALALWIEKIVVNHPNFVVGAGLEQSADWARRGVFVEHSLCMYDPRSHLSQAAIRELLAYMKACGVSRTLFGSDLGQAGNPTPVESYGYILGMLLDEGIAADFLHQIVAENGASLLDL